MSNAQAENLFRYALMALVGALVTTGLQLAQMLSGTDEVLLRPLLATFTTAFFGSLATALGASRLTRFGSERIAADVDALKDQGVSREDMSVIKTEDLALLQAEAQRIRRIKPLRDAAQADEALEARG